MSRDEGLSSHPLCEEGGKRYPIELSAIAALGMGSDRLGTDRVHDLRIRRPEAKS